MGLRFPWYNIIEPTTTQANAPTVPHMQSEPLRGVTPTTEIHAAAASRTSTVVTTATLLATKSQNLGSGVMATAVPRLSLVQTTKTTEPIEPSKSVTSTEVVPSESITIGIQDNVAKSKGYSVDLYFYAIYHYGVNYNSCFVFE